MQRRKGFTLAELLVAIVCASLVLSMVTAAAIFLSRMNDGAVTESKTLFQLQTLKTYVQTNAENDYANGNLNQNYVIEDGRVFHRVYISDGSGVTWEDTVIFENSSIENITFTHKPENPGSGPFVITCTVTYGEGRIFEFIAYASGTN